MTGSEGPDAALPSRCFPGLSLFAEQGLPARQRRESYAYRGKNYADDTCPARNPRPSQSGCSWRRQAKGRASRMSVLLTQRHCWRHGRQGSISGSIELHGLMGRRNCSEFRERNRLWRLDGPPAIANWISAVFSSGNPLQFNRLGRPLRTIVGILSILLGLLWAFHAEVRDIYVNLQPWLARPANLLGEIGPWLLIAGGVLSVTMLHVWPAVHRWLRPSPLDIIYEPQRHACVRRQNLRDYHIEVRNRTTDRTIAGVIVTWDETPFTRFIDRKLSRDWLLSPTSIEASSAVSVLLFSLEDDIQTKGNRNDVLGRKCVITVRANGNGTHEAAARFRYDPGKTPKLKRLWLSSLT